MERTSHALVGREGGVWVVDPVRADGADDLIGELGEVAGVVVTFPHHQRDAAAFARRYDVPVYVPDRLGGVDVGEPTRRFDREPGDSGLRAVPVLDLPGWREVALFRRRDRTLYVPETLGTAPYKVVGDERLGVHPALRPRPPGSLRNVAVDRVRVGHGEGVGEDAAGAVRAAYADARANAPALYAKAVRLALG
jgi:hypothetical protein